MANVSPNFDVLKETSIHPQPSCQTSERLNDPNLTPKAYRSVLNQLINNKKALTI